MVKELIAAIELGSPKITGIAGKKNLGGSISTLTVVKEDSTSCTRKGVVFDIDKTVLCLTDIIKKLETALKVNIVRVYIGVGEQNVYSIKNVIIKDLPVETVITQDMINKLMDANRSMTYAEQEILDAAAQEYKVDTLYQLDPVGIPCLRLEGNFLDTFWRKASYKNLDQCLNKAGVEVAELYLAPLALADTVLIETEKRTGCTSIGLGADTIIVLVYYKNILRHLAVTPLGSENITKDITSLLMEGSQAERMRLKYAPAYTDNGDIDDNKKYPIDRDRKVESRKFTETVEPRLQGITEDVPYQIPNEYADKLIDGIILTDGGSNMPNIGKTFTNQAPTEKTRITKFANQDINSNPLEITAHTGTVNTTLGLLVKGDINYAGEEITADLFQSSEPKHTTSTPAPAKGPRSYTETSGTGIVQTEEEKGLLRKKKEEQEEAERKAQEEEERRIAEEERENPPVNKIWKSIKNSASKITEEEE